VDDVIAGCAFPEGEQGMQTGRILALAPVCRLMSAA
jgi:hypothetical protein